MDLLYDMGCRVAAIIYHCLLCIVWACGVNHNMCRAHLQYPTHMHANRRALGQAPCLPTRTIIAKPNAAGKHCAVFQNMCLNLVTHCFARLKTCSPAVNIDRSSWDPMIGVRGAQAQTAHRQRYMLCLHMGCNYDAHKAWLATQIRRSR